LVLIGLLARVLGLGFLVFAGFELWRVATRSSLGSDVVPLVVGGSIAFALLSIGSSATRTGLKYLRGQKTVARDVGRFVARRIERRRGRASGR
jgi:hypothetical protein